MKNKWIIFMLSLFMISCEEQFDWDTVPQENDLLVVDALLTNEKMNHLVKLSRTNPESNQGWNPASGAVVIISDGEKNELLTEFPVNSGLYYTSSDFRAVFAKQYYLIIRYMGKIYSATDSSVPGEPFTSEELYKDADSGLFELNFTPSGIPSMTRYFLTWSHTEYCQQNQNNDLCSAKVVYYDLKTIGVNENFKPEKEKVLFPNGTIIVRKKYSLSEAYRQFLRSMLSETEWRGGLFDVQRGNAFTNLSEGAVGFFAISTVVTDTTIVQ